ncbi:MAG: hypothetical protein AABW52_02710 [Nanoarchaeota archaeon]
MADDKALDIVHIDRDKVYLLGSSDINVKDFEKGFSLINTVNLQEGSDLGDLVVTSRDNGSNFYLCRPKNQEDPLFKSLDPRLESLYGRLEKLRPVTRDPQIFQTVKELEKILREEKKVHAEVKARNDPLIYAPGQSDDYIHVRMELNRAKDVIDVLSEENIRRAEMMNDLKSVPLAYDNELDKMTREKYGPLLDDKCKLLFAVGEHSMLTLIYKMVDTDNKKGLNFRIPLFANALLRFREEERDYGMSMLDALYVGIEKFGPSLKKAALNMKGSRKLSNKFVYRAKPGDPNYSGIIAKANREPIPSPTHEDGLLNYRFKI